MPIRAIIFGATGMVGEGVSSVGMKEQEYTRLTYDLTMSAASTLSAIEGLRNAYGISKVLGVMYPW